jgi:sugar phosphate isomerase/epimerase
MLGVTLFSFINEWQQRRFTLEQLVAKVAELELGPGIEAVGFQSFRDFPRISDAFAERWRELLARYSLTPTCLGGDIDIGRVRGRVMSQGEMASEVELQIEAARKLGFPVLRVQEFVGPEVLMRVVPAAERADVQVVCELYAPLTPSSPEVVRLRECFDRANSPYLGFMPDFSCSMVAVPAGHWDNLRRAGAPELLIEQIATIWRSDETADAKYLAVAEVGAQFGADARLMGAINPTVTLFGHMPVDAWREILPYVRHIHGKFYAIDEQGHEPSVPYPQLMTMLKETGYSSSISAEWGGSMFTEESISFQQAKAWHTMCTDLLAD